MRLADEKEADSAVCGLVAPAESEARRVWWGITNDRKSRRKGAGIAAMAHNADIMSLVRRAAEARVLFLPHALRQMLRPDRLITTTEVRRVIAEGKAIEDYPEDVRGHSCLILGFGDGGRPIHVVCAPKTDYLAVITAYLPDPSVWPGDFEARIRP